MKVRRSYNKIKREYSFSSDSYGKILAIAGKLYGKGKKKEKGLHWIIEFDDEKDSIILYPENYLMLTSCYRREAPRIDEFLLEIDSILNGSIK